MLKEGGLLKRKDKIAVVWLLSHVQLFVIPWTGASQASLLFTISQSLLKLMSVASVSDAIQPSVIPFSCPQSFPASGSFSVSWLFASGGQSIGVSASASVLPMNIQGWFPLGLIYLISLLSKGLSRVFSSTIVLAGTLLCILETHSNLKISNLYLLLIFRENLQAHYCPQSSIGVEYC